MKRNLSELERYFDLKFNTIGLLEQAMTHPSYANEYGRPSNQRLEFIGDAVIDLTVGKYLYDLMPHEDEGVLTKKRAAEVCEASLSAIAQSFNLGDYLLLGKGEEKSNGYEKPRVLADAFEAFLGAIFIDKGLKEVYKVLNKVVFPFIDQTLEDSAHDYKSILQELVQSDKRTLLYEIIDETGPAHDKTFVAHVKMDGEIIMGMGTGKTKKEAEQAAAKDTLAKMAHSNIQEDES